MKPELLSILVCPSCRAQLLLRDATTAAGGAIESGTLRCSSCRREYPILRSVPRFVPAENYAGSFGFQWNRFPRTQLDSHSGIPITHERFFAQSAWAAEEMRGRWVLDVGCGSGRFAEVALGTGARVVAIDYSAAVDAAQANLGGSDRIDIVQADVYALPFRHEVFDFVYCFGVLQHTPDPKRAFLALTAPLKRGGKVAADVYAGLRANILWPKYWLRPITKRMSKPRLFGIVERVTPALLRVSRIVGRIPFVGRKLRYLVPVANYEGVHPLSEAQLREWAVLDTFDMFSPAHDHPQSGPTLRRWLEEARLERPEVVRTGHVVARGVKP